MAEGKNLVGVDIGASSIKVVQLKDGRKGMSVIRYGYAPLPPQTIIDGHIMSAGVVTDALLKIFVDNKIQTKDVAVGVYGQSVIVRKITVPMMTNEELDEQAEAYKCGGGPTQIVPQEVHQIISQACDSLAGEIQRSLDFYLATSGESEISRIYVSGGSAYLAPLQKAIEKRARVPVMIFDPMANVGVDKTVNEAEMR